MKTMEKRRCITPSTDANNSLIGMQESYIGELLQLIYVENYSYQELVKYFQWSLLQLDGFHSYLQQVERATIIYLEKLLCNLKDLFDFKILCILNSTEILALLQKSYDLSHSKHVQLQLLSDSYGTMDQNQQSINCDYLFKQLFVDVILKDTQIQGFLDRTDKIFQNPFYQKAYKQTYTRLQFFNKLMDLKRKPILKTLTRQIIPTIPTQIKENIYNPRNFPPKPTKKIDEVKLFETKLENALNDSKSLNKLLEINVSQNWIQTYKQKIKKIQSNL